MNRGFTLIELVSVVAILAIITHIAVCQTGAIIESRKTALAERQLSDIKNAVCGVSSDLTAQSGWFSDCFVADMGRLPRALAIDGAGLSLRELWARPDDVAVFEMRPATSENLVTDIETKRIIADAGVFVACGWRGPYINVKNGRLFDVWGNAMESADDAGYMGRLRGLDPNESMVENGEVARISHFGSDGCPDDKTRGEVRGSRRDKTVEFVTDSVRGILGDVAVQVLFLDENGAELPVPSDVSVRWYGPCGGAITGGVAKSATVTPGRFEIENIAAGPHYVRVVSGSVTSSVRRITVRPGANRDIELKMLLR